MQQILTITHEKNSFKVGLFSLKKRKFSVDLLKTVSFDPKNPNVKPLYNLYQNLERKKVSIVSCLQPEQVLVRDWKCELPEYKLSENFLKFQLEKAIPAQKGPRISVVQFDTSVAQKSFLSTEEASLESQIKYLTESDIDPSEIYAFQQALGQWAKWIDSSASKEKHLILYVGLEKTVVVVAENGIISFSQTIQIGVAHFLQALSEDKNELSQNNCLQLASKIQLSRMSIKQFPLLHAQVKLFKQELDRIFAYLEETKMISKETKLYEAGHINASFQMQRLLKEITQNPRVEIDDKQEISSSDLQKYAAVIGLGFLKTEKFSDQQQFRVGSFTQFKVEQKRKQSIRQYLMMSALLLCASIGFTQLLQNSKFKKIAKSFSSYSHISTTNTKQLETEIEMINHSMRNQSGALFLKHHPAKVSHFLSWLSQTIEKSQAPNAEILHFEYHYKTYPTLDKLKVPYLVQAEIEIQVNNQAEAKELHHVLSKENQWIETKKGFDWSYKKNRVKTTFYIK